MLFLEAEGITELMCNHPTETVADALYLDVIGLPIQLQMYFYLIATQLKDWKRTGGSIKIAGFIQRLYYLNVIERGMQEDLSSSITIL